MSWHLVALVIEAIVLGIVVSAVSAAVVMTAVVLWILAVHGNDGPES